MTKYPPQDPPPEGYPSASGLEYQQSQYPSAPPQGAPYPYPPGASYGGGYPQQGYGSLPYNNGPPAQPYYSSMQQPLPRQYIPSNMQEPYREYPPPTGPPPGYSPGSNFPFFSPPSHQQESPATGPYQGVPPPNAEGDDRGIVGALAGGVAGAYGGHKVGHGLLGALGGAFAGHKLEDAYKEHKQEKKEKKHSRRGSRSSSSSSASSDYKNDKHSWHEEPVMAGNFHASSRNVHIENESILVAECADIHGHYHWSKINLNDCLTNSFGRFEWAKGGNFKASARYIRLGENGSMLEAELGDGRGGKINTKVYLNERITNDNGRLMMI